MKQPGVLAKVCMDMMRQPSIDFAEFESLLLLYGGTAQLDHVHSLVNHLAQALDSDEQLKADLWSVLGFHAGRYLKKEMAALESARPETEAVQ